MSNWKIKEKFNLPDRWEICRFHDLTSQIVDGTHFTPKYIESGVPFLRVTDIQSTKVDFSRLKFISKEEHDLLKLRCFPQKGDILISKNGSIGIIKIVDWEWEFSLFVSVALVKTKKEIYNQYLKHLLQSEIIWWQIKLRAKQGTVTNLHLEEIRELEIPKPSLTEQRQIATILSTADAVIEKTQAAIAKCKAIKQGMLQDLFTRGLVSEKVKGKSEKGEEEKTIWKLRPSYQDAPELYKESKLGWIPKEWEALAVADVSENLDGKRIPVKQGDRDNQAEIYPYYGASGIIDLVDNFIFDEPLILLGEDGENVISRNLPLAFKVEGKIWVNNHAHVLKPIKNISTIDFLCEVLETVDYTPIVSGSAQPKITQGHLNKILLPIPTIEEQEIISLRMVALNQKLQTEQNFLHKQQQIKAGLMNDLLSGRKKVIIKEKEIA